MKPLKIKNLNIKSRFFLAPMAEVNDIAFRLLCKKAGAGLTYTGMINPLTQKSLMLDDKPALQLFSTSEKGIKEFIKKYDNQVSLWDFNLGCPAKTARKLGFGVFMHTQLKEIEKILKTIRESTEKPVTIKLRKSKYTLKILKILKIAEKYIDAVTIHPRTQQQGYSGKPDLEFAEKIKSKTKLPVIYSGNVDENNAKKLLKKFDFIMIGRAAAGNPNIFAKLTDKKQINCKKFDFFDYLELAKEFSLLFKQVKLQAMNFTKGKHGATEMRKKLIKARTIEEIKKIYD